MSNIIKKYPFLILFAIALVWQLFLILSLQLHQQHLIFPDSQNYLRASKILYYALESHHHRPIGISLVTGIPWLFKASESFIYSWSWALNLICWLGTIFLLFEILKGYIKSSAAFIISAVYLFCVGPAILTMHLLSETYYVFIIILVIFCLLKYEGNQNAKYLFFALSLLVISWLFRPISKYLVFLIVIIYSKDILSHYKNRYSILVLVSLLFVVLQCGMNYHKFGNYKVSYIDSFTMYNYVDSQAEAKRLKVERKRFSEQRYQDFMALSFPERERLGKSDFKYHLTKNTKNLVTSWIGNIYENATVPSLSFEYLENINQTQSFITINKGLRSLSTVQNIVISSIGVILLFILSYKVFFLKSFRLSDHKLELFLGLMIAYLLVASGISFGQGDRFNAVVYPFIFIFAAQIGLFRTLKVR